MSFAFPLSALAPVLLLLAAFVMRQRPDVRPSLASTLPEAAALTALALALVGIAQTTLAGPTQVMLFDGPFKILLRLDAVSATLTFLVAFIGWIVIRYSVS